MKSCGYHIIVVAIASVLLFVLPVAVHGWGVHGHFSVCNIAQSRLKPEAAAAVKDLLPAYAENDLGSLCSWADEVKRAGYPWSIPLHFVNTPDKFCNYSYVRDCKDTRGTHGICAVAAIRNYTTQLLDYRKAHTEYNLTEALLFLSHFVGDMHQPLHEGFVSDRGGNEIKIHWYNIPSNLHRAWDDNIIDTAKERFYSNDVQGLIEAIKTNITREWASPAQKWENTCGNQIACPDIYASEGISIACRWAYVDDITTGHPVVNGSVLKDEYFGSREQIVYQQLAKGGIRLASILNKIFVPMTSVN